jgi:hypothetical protein
MVYAYRQHGLTLIGFFFICALVGFFALVVLKLFPYTTKRSGSMLL